MLLRRVVFVLFGLYGLLALAQPAPNQVTNADIGKMLKAGVDQKIVKWVIDNSDGRTLDAAPGAIQGLKAAGASQTVLDAVSAKATKAKKAPAPVSAATTLKSATHSTKISHATATVAALRKPATSSRTAKQIESLQAETCEDTLQTVDDCHANHKTGCTKSENPRYDAYLNYLKNSLPDPASTASSEVNGGNPLGADFFAQLESGIPDTLGSTNHAQHATELAQAGEGQIVTLIGTLYYTIHGGSETCNCQLSGDDSVIDFHIGIGFAGFPLSADVLSQLRSGSDYSKILSVQDQHALDQSSVVVEMTPYYREQFRPGWALSKVQNATGRQVKVTGQLMIDNVHHKPADDCGLGDADSGKCWRLSVWEVHPVTSFQVCNADHCDATSTNWVNLEDM
jgi:hypothetical protein